MSPPEAQPAPPRSPPPRSALIAWLRRFAALWGFALFLLFVLVAFRAVILPFALGVLVAYVLAPVVSAISGLRFGGHRSPRWLSVILVYLGLSAVLGGFFAAFAPHLSTDFARLFREAPRFLTRLKRELVPQADAWVEQNFPGPVSAESALEPLPPQRKLVLVDKGAGRYELDLQGLQLELEPSGRGRYVIGPRSDSDDRQTRLSELLNQAARSTETELKSVLLVGKRFVTSVIKTFAWFVLTFMVAAYLLIDLDRVMAFLRSLVPEQHRSTFDELVVQVDRGLAGVIRGQLMICVVNGILTTIGLLLFRVKYALLLGLVAGTMSFIPVFGSILSSVPIVMVALASGPEGISPSTALAVLGWIIGVHFLEANLFNPKIIGSAAKIHPVVVVFALLVGEETGGLVGALLAVPIVSMVQVVFLYFRGRARSVEVSA